MIKPILYPIFLEFANNTKDEYWSLLYQDMAYGKFPQGAYIQNEHFCCFHMGKEFSIKLNPNDFSVFTQIHSLLRTNLGISSEKEKLQLRQESLQLSQSTKDIKRVIKDSTLTSFILREGEKHCIPDNIIRRIFSLFVIGFMFKTIVMKDVVFDNKNNIRSIKGFSFSSKKVKINKNVFEIKTINIPDENHKTEPISLSTLWPKYLQTISSLTDFN